MLEIMPEKRLVLSPNIILQRIEDIGKFWVFNTVTGEHYTINQTTYWILSKIMREVSIDSLFQDFLSEFDVTSNRAHDDFAEILEQCIQEGILIRR